MFEKVNTGGVTLSMFELVTASFAAQDENLSLRETGIPAGTDCKARSVRCRGLAATSSYRLWRCLPPKSAAGRQLGKDIHRTASRPSIAGRMTSWAWTFPTITIGRIRWKEASLRRRSFCEASSYSQGTTCRITHRWFPLPPYTLSWETSWRQPWQEPSWRDGSGPDIRRGVWRRCRDPIRPGSRSSR